MRGILLVALVMCAAPAVAQINGIEECAAYKRFIDDIAAGTDRTVELVDVGQTARCVAVYAAGFERASFKEFVRLFEGSRADKQSGEPGGTGSTSIVSRGPVAKVLSLAAEHGALTQSISEQTVTVRGNLAGIPVALLRRDVFPYCAGDERLSGFCVPGSVLSTLRRISFAVSFDPTGDEATITATPSEGGSGTAQPVTFQASRREITSASMRIDLWNRRDVSSSEFAGAFKAQVGTVMNRASADLLLAAGNFAEAIVEAPGYEEWRRSALAKVRAAGRDRGALVAALTESLELLLPIARAAVPDFDVRARAALVAYSRYFLAQDELIEPLALKNVLAFEYTNSRPVGQAATSQFRVIADLPLTSNTKFVANGAITIYNSVPETVVERVKRLRDARVGVQLDHALSGVSILGPAVASAAIYYQEQNTATLLEVDPANPLTNVTFIGLPDDVSHVFTNTGSIWLVQAKLSLTPRNSSIKVPLAVTYSNRTELIDKPAWAAQVGIAYDFDSLFGVLSQQ